MVDRSSTGTAIFGRDRLLALEQEPTARSSGITLRAGSKAGYF
jgi:hypothetical protein